LDLLDALGKVAVVRSVSGTDHFGESPKLSFEDDIGLGRALPMRLHLMIGVLQV
jgi:hypothetical protein